MEISKSEYNKLKKIEENLNKSGLTKKKLNDLAKYTQADEIKIKTSHLLFDSYTFAVIADTHINSTHEKLDELHTFYKLLDDRNITQVFHAGDLIAGQGIYTGQEYDLKNIGVDNQVKYFVENFPYYENIETAFITGNHDLSFFKIAGIDVGVIIDEKRDDMVYLGQYEADIRIDNQINIRLFHPNGGQGSTVSGSGERIIRNIPVAERPDILAIGHFHINGIFFYQNVQVIFPGCFEGRTDLFKRFGKFPVTGGYIVTVKVNEESINPIGIETEFIIF